MPIYAYEGKQGEGMTNEETFLLEDSDIDCGWPCPKCDSSGRDNFKKDRTFKDKEGEITHWSAHCVNCGLKGTIFND